MNRTLILGAGFGGITVATELRRLLGDDHDIVLVDRSERFTMGLRKLWALVGIEAFEDGSRSREALNEGRTRFVRREIARIDPAGRRVATVEGELEGDYLVIALGAESRPDLVPGLEEHAHDVWDPEGVPTLQDALDRFNGGAIAVVIAGVPYTCPPAPFECCLLLDDHLRERGLRKRTKLTVTTLQPMLLPNAGTEGSAWLAERLAARGIEFGVGRKVERFEAGRVVYTDGALEADPMIAVPPHRAPLVVRDSGLTGDGDWIPVDPVTLATTHENVFAIGDVTQIKLANGLPLPKAGAIAESEGLRVAAAIAARERGEPEPPGFDGRGHCFMEMSKTSAALIEGEFYATPEPRVVVGDVSPRHAEDKHRFEAERLTAWFGDV